MKTLESKQHPDENLNACDTMKVLLLWMLTLAGGHKMFERWVSILEYFSADMALRAIL